jgi:sarcosine oxidase
MGSASAYHLARAGRRVLGLDRFHPPHTLGSSHGLTRIIREAYFEHPSYVPLVQRAYKLWDELEKESSQKLFLQTGGLMIGPPHGTIVTGALRSAREHNLSHEILSAPEIGQRFPAFHPDNEMIAVHEPRAGILFPERAVEAHLALAEKHGADLRFDEAVVRWEPREAGVRVVTIDGEYLAKRLLLSAGSWLSDLVPDLHLPLSVERQVLFWFEPAAGNALAFTPANCPIYICEHEAGHYFYGFPDLGDGVKVAIHHEGSETTPASINREVTPAEINATRVLLHRYLPGASGALKAASVCMYTNTPDEHFILDFHPNYSQVLIASPCSGHGFKFSPVIGEIAAAMLTGRKPGFDLALFRLGRFS